jgi:hypothetical protein
LERAEVLPFERRYCLNRWTPICGRTGSVQLDVRLDLVRRGRKGDGRNEGRIKEDGRTGSSRIFSKTGREKSFLEAASSS